MSGSLVGVLILLGCGFAPPASARHAVDLRSFSSSCKTGQFRPIPDTGCKKYQECVFETWQTSFSFSCEGNTVFNHKSQTCDWHYNVDLSTCHSHHRPDQVSVTSDPVPVTSHTPTHYSHETGSYKTCGTKRCYHGHCHYSQYHDGYGWHSYNYHCVCVHGYTGESCSQEIEKVTVTSTPVTTVHTPTHYDHSTQCGNNRCYHGTCWYSLNCNGCPHYNHHCQCKHGYTGESCSQEKDRSTSSTTVSTSPTTTAHQSPQLGHWFKCGNIHCYHSSNCGYTCKGGSDYWGHCLHPVDHHCDCHAGYTGDTCTLKKVSDKYCYSRGLPCHSGHCAEDLTTSNYVCHCSSGYTGDDCELRIVDHNECHYYDLRCDHGDCVTDVHNSMYHGKHWCNCHKGYTGQHCNETATTTTSTVATTTIPVVAITITSDMPITPPLTPPPPPTPQTPTPPPTTMTPTTTLSPTTTTIAPTTTAPTMAPTTTTLPTTTTTKMTHTTTKPPATLAPTTTKTQTTMAPITTPQSSPTMTPTEAPTTTTTLATTTTVPTTTTEAFSATPYRTSTSVITTPDTTTSTTISSTQTSTAPIHFFPCNKINTVLDIGQHVMANNSNVVSCPSGSFTSPEAFVLAHCQISHPSNWTQGISVMQQCHSIPLYTPIATFVNNKYTTSGSLSGMLLGCLPDGFKLGVQRCDHAPDIVHIVTGGLFAMDPNVYYTVQ